MAVMGSLLAILIIGYLIGSVPTAHVVMHVFRKRDLREIGTGNVTSTAVVLHGGRALGALSLTGEILKTFLCLLIAYYLVGQLWAYLVILVAASIGQIWCIWLGWNGGRGQTIFVTGFLVLCPVPFLVSVAIFSMTLLITRRFYFSNQFWHAMTPLILLLATVYNPTLFGPGELSWAYALTAIALCGMFFIKNRTETDDILQTQAWGTYSK